jgi:hypothetical protein
MAFLEFTFASFWHFAGVFILIALVFHGISAVVEAFRRKQ